MRRYLLPQRRNPHLYGIIVCSEVAIDRRCSLIRKQTITTQVIDYILDLIKKGQVKPGERLPTEKQLTEELAVSRTCVREAIKSLQSLQFITVKPKIGAVGLEPSAGALLNAEYLST